MLEHKPWLPAALTALLIGCSPDSDPRTDMAQDTEQDNAETDSASKGETTKSETTATPTPPQITTNGSEATSSSDSGDSANVGDTTTGDVALDTGSQGSSPDPELGSSDGSSGEERRLGSPDGTGPFLEHNGRVVFEAESVPENGNWVVHTQHEGYSGVGFMEHCSTRSCTSGDSSRSGDVLSYAFEILEGGTYQVHMYSHQAAPNGGAGRDWELNNDVMLRIPGSMTPAPAPDEGEDWAYSFNEFESYHKVYVGSDIDYQLHRDREGRAEARAPLANLWRWWLWTDEPHRNAIRIDLEPGVYQLDVEGRSDGFSIDKVVIVRWTDLAKRQPTLEEGLQWHAWENSWRR